LESNAARPRALCSRTRSLPGSGIRPRPLIELLRNSRDDARDFKQLVAANPAEGGGQVTHKPGGAAVVGSGASAKTLLYSMESMGCQMNSADAERMEGQLRSLGFAKANEPRDAQVVVLNTCATRR